MPTGFNSLTVRLTVSILLINAVVLSFLGVAYSRRFGEYIERQLATQSRIPGMLISESSLNHALARDTEALGQLAGRRVLEAMVVRESGRILYGSAGVREGEKLRNANPAHPIFEQLSDGGGTLEVRASEVRTERSLNLITPLRAHGQVTGYFWISLDIQEDMRLKREVTLIFFFGTLACILIGGFAQAIIVHRMVLPRVQRAVACLSAVENGDFSARIKARPAADEIGVLEQGVNAMVTVIEQRTGAMRDATHEMELAKEAAEEARGIAERASEAKSQFLANTSHEIRTPLNGILGMSEILLDSDLPPHNLQHVETILNLGENLLEIINNILDLSCVESGHVEILLEPIDSARFFDELERSFVPSTMSSGVPLKLKVDENIPRYLKAAHGPLRQIFTNLITNAFKFTRQGHVAVEANLVELDAGEHRCLVEFCVHDTGIGIPEEARAKIFEAFTQADGSSTRSYGGTGLGLTISSQLVSRLCGDLTVESEVGEGSSFRFTLPFSYLDEMPADAATARAPEEADPLDGARILVAEDNKVNRLMVKTFLKGEGCEVAEAEDGSMALAALGLQEEGAATEHNYDLVLMDIQMPILDGIEATKLIRQREDPARRVPIVAFTAHAMRGDKEVFVAAGMNDYVAKPIRKQQLLEVLRGHIGAPVTL